MVLEKLKKTLITQGMIRLNFTKGGLSRGASQIEFEEGQEEGGEGGGGGRTKGGLRAQGGLRRGLKGG